MQGMQGNRGRFAVAAKLYIRQSRWNFKCVPTC